MSIKFKNREHEKFYEQCLARTGGLDPYHKAFFYTMGISDETRKHVEDVFDFQEDVIRPEGLNKGWQTSGSSCLTRLAFNLWNGWNADGYASQYLELQEGLKIVVVQPGIIERNGELVILDKNLKAD